MHNESITVLIPWNASRFQGVFALVDIADAPVVDGRTWYLSESGYAIRSEGGRVSRRTVYMHREVFGNASGDVDHINRNKLDNRRANLRSATRSENNANADRGRNSSSGYRGVSWSASAGKWQVHIRVEGKRRFLGLFESAEEAAAAYDAAFVDAFGEFARPNLSR